MTVYTLQIAHGALFMLFFVVGVVFRIISSKDGGTDADEKTAIWFSTFGVFFLLALAVNFLVWGAWVIFEALYGN